MLNTILLILLNIIAGLVLAKMTGLETHLKETRQKLDHHVEDFGIHGLSRPGQSRRQEI